MEKREVSHETACYPMPCSIVGAHVNGKPNYLTVAWFTMVNFKPPYILIALGKTHYTNPGIKENRAFSINIPSASMVEVTDYCGIVSGRKVDKSALFETFYGKLRTAPMIKECPYNLECRLVQAVDLPADELFIGEVVAAYSDDRYLTNGIPDLHKIDPFVLSMTESSLSKLGPEIGKAWEIGKRRLQKKK